MWCRTGDLLDLVPHRTRSAVDARSRIGAGCGDRTSRPASTARAREAAEIPRLAGGDGFCQRWRIHVRDHQHVARSGKISWRRRSTSPSASNFGVSAALFELMRGRRRPGAAMGELIGQRSPQQDRAAPPSTLGGGAAHQCHEPHLVGGAVAERAQETRRHRRDAPAWPGRSRSDMQVCSASISTATPRGFRTSSIAVATCEVRDSWVCSRRA